MRKITLFFISFILFLSTIFCQDPPTPPGGFDVLKRLDLVVTLSDGLKTKADFMYPKHTPGPKGWPLVVLIHGMGGSRTGMRPVLEDIASLGYAGLAYDVRGQGDAKRLSPRYGTQFISMPELIDLAEMIEWAHKTFPNIVDINRVGITGGSQGGLHSWAAAAMSGKKFPPNSRRSKPFPIIKAAIPTAFPPDKAGSALPLGKTCHTIFLHYVCGYPGFIMDPTLKTKISSLLLAERYEDAYKLTKNIPLSSFMNELKKTTTPIFAMLSWFDIWADPTSAIDIMKSIPSSTPFRLYLQGIGHGLTINQRQAQRAILLTAGWFERFLKNNKYAIEKEAKVLCAVPPPTNLQAINPFGLWMPRESWNFPPKGIHNTSFYLKGGGKLEESQPTTNYNPAVIHHRVPQGYTVKKFVPIALDIFKILAVFPLSRIKWTSGVFKRDTEIAGFPKVELFIKPTHKRFQFHCGLFIVSPSGGEEMISSGVFAETLQSGLKTTKVNFRMGPIDAVIPKGWRIRLYIENLSILRYPPGAGFVKTVPYMHNYDINIYLGKQFKSRIILPIRNKIPASLETWDAIGSVSRKNTIRFVISGTSLRAGLPYILFCGLSGQYPMTPLPGGAFLPLNIDYYTQPLLGAANTQGFPGFIGSLSGVGEAYPKIVLKKLPVTPEMAGLKMTVAGIILNGMNLSPTTAVDIYFEP